MLFLIIIFPLSFTILTLTNVIATTTIVILRVFQQLAKKQVSPSLFPKHQKVALNLRE